ncbi:MAG: alanine racemase [Nocardioidaceae bacterium]|nr:alanine racemase [Nocardioidaceae bacterium]
MPLTLRIEGDRWRSHLRRTAETYGVVGQGIVPVVKGNGYGFGLASLARRSAWLGADAGVDTVATGMYEEVPELLSRFAGDVLVLSPWRPFLSEVPDGDRVVHTVGRLDDLAALGAQRPGARIVVEALTTMSRHGLPRHELAAATDLVRAGRLRLSGLALHLPLVGEHEPEAEEWAAVLEASQLDTSTMWVSHLDAQQIGRLRARRPRLLVRPRVGTALWLGDRGALTVRATVLDRHPVSRGDRVGYRQRPLPRAGHVLVVAGGTAHGIGLAAPAAGSARQRALALARGGLEAAGMTLSPYTVGGRQRWFVEPPHMQVSLIFVPAGAGVPDVGDEVDVAVRFTTTTFDHIEIG